MILIKNTHDLVNYELPIHTTKRINKELSALSDKIEAEAENYENLNQAIKLKQKEALLIKGFEGEKNVLKAKIAALESLTKDQGKQIEKLNNQQEKAYNQAQESASKAVAGAAERAQNITVRTSESDKNN